MRVASHLGQATEYSNIWRKAVWATTLSVYDHSSHTLLHARSAQKDKKFKIMSSNVYKSHLWILALNLTRPWAIIPKSSGHHSKLWFPGGRCCSYATCGWKQQSFNKLDCPEVHSEQWREGGGDFRVTCCTPALKMLHNQDAFMAPWPTKRTWLFVWFKCD